MIAKILIREIFILVSSMYLGMPDNVPDETGIRCVGIKV
jgi:hypothetical protein